MCLCIDICIYIYIHTHTHTHTHTQGGSNMTGTDLCVNLATSVPVIFEPPCIYMRKYIHTYIHRVEPDYNDMFMLHLVYNVTYSVVRTN